MMQIPSLKNITKHYPIENLPDPPEFFMPLHSYKGILLPVVRIGQYVRKYELLAESEGVFAAKLHAPASGVIAGFEEINGKAYIKLVNDFKDDALVLPDIDPERLEPAQLLEIIKEFGIEGSGGARFPAHTKYTVNDNKIDVFIINGAECEPYLTADYALMQDKTEALFKAIISIQKIIRAKKVVFGIEKQHKELAAVLKKHGGMGNFPVEIKLLPNTYPQGGELQLIKSVTGKELPKGCIPAQHGIVVSNVGTLWAMYNALYHSKPYIERIITLSGTLATKKGNYNVKIGTPVSFLRNFSGIANTTKKYQVIVGGPMMGRQATNHNTPVTKGTGGVLIIPEAKNQQYNCIECGYCADACPQRLMPMEFARFTQKKDTDKLIAYHLTDCIECGACAYICPSDVPLMRSIFYGKELIQGANTI